MHVTYVLTHVTDPAVTQHGWATEITVYQDGEGVVSKLYRSLAAGRRALGERVEVARSSGHCTVESQDATLPVSG